MPRATARPSSSLILTSYTAVRLPWWTGVATAVTQPRWAGCRWLIWSSVPTGTVSSGAASRAATEAADGEEAVRLADEHELDLCVMDVKMPVLDGITAAERILDKHSCAVVMLTAFSQSELIERAS